MFPGKGGDFYKSEEDILLVRWYDNRDVTVGTNHYSVEPVGNASRWDKGKGVRTNIPCPQTVKAYNAGMGGVDRCDQLLSFYRIRTKSVKWYKRLLYHFVDLALVNSFVLYKHLKKPLPLWEFKLQVALSLMNCGNFGNPTSRASLVLRELHFATNGDPIGGPGLVDAVRLDGFNHFADNVAKVGRMCKLSSCKNMRTTIWCNKCKVYLCIKKGQNCFIEYHTVP